MSPTYEHTSRQCSASDSVTGVTATHLPTQVLNLSTQHPTGIPFIVNGKSVVLGQRGQRLTKYSLGHLICATIRSSQPFSLCI